MRFLIVYIFVAGCGVFAPQSRTSADRAREAEPKCNGVSDGSIAHVTSPTSISLVEPAYSYVLGGPNGRAARLRGAKIHLATGDGLTKETLTRTLRCHEARVVLGKTQPR